MNLYTFVLVILAVVVSVIGLKDPACGEIHARNGDGFIACAAFIPSWSYKPETNECVEFVYGGCGGNNNRFDTKEKCEAKCKE